MNSAWYYIHTLEMRRFWCGTIIDPRTPGRGGTVNNPALIGLGSHVWAAPWQELSDVSAALVGCGHVSGLT